MVAKLLSMALMLALPAISADAAQLLVSNGPPPKAAIAPPVDTDAYVLGVNDEVEITVFGRTDTKVTTRIAEDGTVTFPYVGTVAARGETPRSLGARIAARLKSGGYFTNPIVNVAVKSFISNAVTVFGNVNQPGVLPLDRSLTLAMMIARAGGVRPDAANFAILKHAGEPAEQKVQLADLDSATGSGVALRAGDTIFVPPAEQFFVYGQVNAPGEFALQGGMTIRQALAKAGGPTLGGSENKVSLYRNGHRTKKVPLDERVQANDILRVGERLF